MVWTQQVNGINSIYYGNMKKNDKRKGKDLIKKRKLRK